MPKPPLAIRSGKFVPWLPSHHPFARHQVKVAAGVGLVIPLDQLFGAQSNPASVSDRASNAESTGYSIVDS